MRPGNLPWHVLKALSNKLASHASLLIKCFLDVEVVAGNSCVWMHAYICWNFRRLQSLHWEFANLGSGGYRSSEQVHREIANAAFQVCARKCLIIFASSIFSFTILVWTRTISKWFCWIWKWGSILKLFEAVYWGLLAICQEFILFFVSRADAVTEKWRIYQKWLVRHNLVHASCDADCPPLRRATASGPCGRVVY